MQKESLQNRNGIVKTVSEWESAEAVSQPVVEAPVEEATEVSEDEEALGATTKRKRK